jgi:hypothetical protein
VLASVNANRKAVSVSSLPAGFVFSVGDFIQIGSTDLHQVMEAATAAGGTTPQFEVRPHIWTGVNSGAVSVKYPHCIMTVLPGSIMTDAGLNGWGTVSFEAMEYRV